MKKYLSKLILSIIGASLFLCLAFIIFLMTLIFAPFAPSTMAKKMTEIFDSLPKGNNHENNRR